MKPRRWRCPETLAAPKTRPPGSARSRRPKLLRARDDWGRPRGVAFLLPPGHPGGDAAVPAGARDRAAGARRYGTRRHAGGGRDSGSHSWFALHRNRGFGTIPTRSTRKVHGGPGQGALALRLFAVRRRPAHLHRGGVRHDRGCGNPGILVDASALRRLPGGQPKPVARVTLRPAGGMPLLISAR